MRTTILCGILALGLLPFCASRAEIQAQEGGVKLGAEHKALQALAGVFDAEVKMYLAPGDKPNVSKGTMTRTMILNGHYLQEAYEGEFFGSPFKGLGTIGFDQTQGKYVATWIDTMSTGIGNQVGTYDATKKVYTFTGEELDPTSKKKLKTRDVLTVVSADVQNLQLFRQPEGGDEKKVMDITLTRRKK